MIRVAINQLLPGMTVAKNVYNVRGSLLLAQDITLDNQLIEKLSVLGIDCIYIKHPFLEIEPQEIIQEKTRVEAIEKINTAMENFNKTGTVNLDGIQEVVRKILEEAVDNQDVMIHITDIRTHDNYTFGHSVNVCLLSAMVGIKMGLNQKQLMELAMGALLHDLGKVLIPLDILNKEGKISSAEWEMIKAHATDGFEVLRKHGKISLLCSHIAFQHHENFDGSGYPRGLAGEDIHLYARIVAVADIYDAVCFDRPYRKAFLPHEAYELIASSSGVKLDPSIASLFLESVALYPIGTSVRLDTGEIGMVVSITPKLQMRPIIKLIADKYGNPWSGPERIVDLTEELTRFIVKVFSPEEVFVLSEDVFTHSKEKKKL